MSRRMRHSSLYLSVAAILRTRVGMIVLICGLYTESRSVASTQRNSEPSECETAEQPLSQISHNFPHI